MKINYLCDMKRTIAAIVIIVVGILLYFVLAPSSEQETTVPSQEPPSEAKLMSKSEIATLVKQQSRLYSAEQTAHKTIILSTAEKDSISTLLGTLKWTRPWSKSHIEIPINVTYKAYIDFSKITEDDIHINADSSITITLPNPVIEMTSCEINHNKEVYDSQIFASQKSQDFINHHVTDAANDVWHEIGRISQDKILNSAKANANNIIANALLGSGYKKVNIEYRHGLNINGLTIDTGKILGNIKY